MLIEAFVERAMEQDNRNIFRVADLNVMVPDPIREFYQRVNPIVVEVTIWGNVVKFIPAAELRDRQKEYLLGDERFIFATCNGDPIYVYENKIYTCCHGIGEIDDELLAENFALFLDLID